MSLEVERKFLPSALNLIAKNAGTPAFRNLKSHPTSTFVDTYYDQGSRLRDLGIWLRQRDQQWQAKVKMGGNYINSQFREVEEPGNIAVLLLKYLPISKSYNEIDPSLPKQLQKYDLIPFANFTTTRQNWTAVPDDNGSQVSIVVDGTDFGHVVGEVELQMEYDDCGTIEAQTDAIRSMNAQLDKFMAKHRWAFPQAECKGKLSAYFDWKKHHP